MLIISAQLSDTGPITCVARNRSGEAVAQVQTLKKCNSRNYCFISFVVEQIFREANISSHGYVNYQEFVKIVCAPVPDYY